jgi:hypothetical protein
MGIPYLDPNGTPADNSRAAQARRLAPMVATAYNGDPIQPKAEPVTVPDAIGMTDPGTALAVIKAANGLGVDHATVNTLLDSAAFVAAVTGVSADEITAAITARTSTAPSMAPNRAQGRADNGPVTQPVRTLRDSLRDKGRLALGSYLRDLS